MSQGNVWTPELLDELLEGEWVHRAPFEASSVAISAKSKVESALFIGYSDETFRRYMGDCNFVRFSSPDKAFGNHRSALRAAERGWAAALIVERPLPVEQPQLIVEDAFYALERLAVYNRSRVKSKIVAVTGTVGKSSTLRALKPVFGEKYTRLSRSNTRRSLALGMANLAEGSADRVVLAEVSVSALWGDDAGVSGILRPDVAVLTEIGLGMTHRVPTEFDTAAVKSNLFDNAPEGGVALINEDMMHRDYVRERAEAAGRAVWSFGFDQDADFQIQDQGIAESADGSLKQTFAVMQGEASWRFDIPTIGAAHAYAATAAFAVAATLGCDREESAARTADYTPSSTVEKIYAVSSPESGAHITVVDGTFSATPLSMRSSFRLASQVHRHLERSPEGELVAVIARIVALEEKSSNVHRELVQPLKDEGFDKVFTYGPELEEMQEELKRQGIFAGHLDSPEAAVDRLMGEMKDASTVLLKGSKRDSDFRLVSGALERRLHVDMQARRVRVTGRVQGVGFRRWVRRHAESLGLVGWVRNSGTDVEFLVQGQRRRVDALVNLCDEGPDRSDVATVNEEHVDVRSALTRFRVRPTMSPDVIDDKALHDGKQQTQPDTERILSGDEATVSPTWPERYTAEVVEQAFGSQKLSSFCLALEAWRRGLRVSFSSPAGVRFSVSDGQKDVSFNGSRSSLTTRSAIRTVDDKNATLQRLQKAGVPTPKSRMFDMSAAEVTELITCAETEYRWPVVVKPVSGSRGDGVFANISTTDELRSCLQHITNELGATRVLLEEHARGDDFRIYVVGETVAAACQRVPANVIGDGRSSVKALIRAKNAERRKNPFLSKGLIKVDVEIESMLHRQSLGLDDIPEDGRYVQLRQKANASAGGDVVDVTDSLPEEVKQAAATAVKAVPGLEAAGVDVLLDMDADSPGDAFVVIELNARAHIGVNMYPTVGSGVDVPSVLLDHFFPETVGLNNRAADTAVFDLNTVLKPLQIGSAEDVTVKQMPQTAYPSRRCVEFDEAVRLTDRTAARLRRASRISGAVGAFEFSSDHARLIVCGEQEHVQDFLRRAQQILGRDLTEITPWNGLVVNGFQVRRIAEPTGRNA